MLVAAATHPSMMSTLCATDLLLKVQSHLPACNPWTLSLKCITQDLLGVEIQNAPEADNAKAMLQTCVEV